jgi:hypothetical protein
MSKSLIALFVSSVFTIQAFCQDILTLRDGRTFKVSVVEVSKKDVSYRKFDNPKGPLYRAEVKDIARIDYESGASDEFAQSNSSSYTKVQNNSEIQTYDPKKLGRNIIAIDALSLLFQNVSLSYERIVGDNGKLGLFVPVSINMSGPSDNTGIINSRNIFYSGLDAHYYPLGQGEFKFYVGPSLRIGTARISNDYYEPAFDIYINESMNSSYFSFLVKLGIQYNPVPELSLGTSLGIGTRRYFYNIPNGNVAGSTGFFNFTMGYRF